MKIKPEHYKVMKEAIAEVATPEKLIKHREFLTTDAKQVATVRDVEKRLRWDALWAARLSPWLSDNVYPYANDQHVDTALRSILAEILKEAETTV